MILLKAKRIWYLICFVVIIRHIFFPVASIHMYTIYIYTYVYVFNTCICLCPCTCIWITLYATRHDIALECQPLSSFVSLCVFCICIFFIISQYLYLLCVFLWKDSFTSVFIKDGGEVYNISVWPVTMRQLGLALINRPTLPMDHGTHGWNCPCTSPLHTQPLYPWTYKPSLPMGGYTRLPSLYRACIASKPLNRLTHDGTFYILMTLPRPQGSAYCILHPVD